MTLSIIGKPLVAPMTWVLFIPILRNMVRNLGSIYGILPFTTDGIPTRRGSLRPELIFGGWVQPSLQPMLLEIHDSNIATILMYTIVFMMDHLGYPEQH